MKLKTFALLCTLVLFSVQLQAQSGLGIGAIINNPDGISLRSSINGDLAVDGAVSFTISENTSSLYLHSNLLYDGGSDAFNLESGQLSTYYGGGLRLIIRENFDNTFGVRIPLGIRYVFEDQPFDVFTELVPTLDVEPGFLFSFNGGIGFRYYLN